jgi:hypothetical protein
MILREEFLKQFNFCDISDIVYCKSSYPGSWPQWEYTLNRMDFDLKLLCTGTYDRWPDVIHTITITKYGNFNPFSLEFDYERNTTGDINEGVFRWVDYRDGYDDNQIIEKEEIIPMIFKFMEPFLSKEQIRNYKLNNILI